MDDTTWISDEPRWTAIVRRVLRRAVRRWVLVLSLALVGTAGLVALRLTRMPMYEARLYFRIAEGEVVEPGSGPHPPRAIREHIYNVALSRSRLRGILEKHGWATNFLARDPVRAVDEFREDIGVEVTRNYFLYDRRPTDEPRTAHVTLSLLGTDPEETRAVLHDIGQAILDEQAAHRTDRLTQARQLVEAQIAQARARLRSVHDRASLAGRNPGVPGSTPQVLAPRAESRALVEQLARLEMVRSQLVFSSTAEERDLGLTFELYDERVHPTMPPVSRRRAAVVTLATFLLLLLLATLGLGTFDDRVCAEEDLQASGIPLLGMVARFPGDDAGAHRARASARGV